MAGLWEDADEANLASLEQLLRKGAEKMGFSKKKVWKAWPAMTEAEQKEELEERRRLNLSGASYEPQTFMPYTQPYVARKECVHTGYTDAFTMFNGSLTIAGARNGSITFAPPDTKLIIDLVGGVKPNTKPWVTSAPEALKNLVDAPVIPPPILKLDWPDRDEPRCDTGWWGQLLQGLVQHYSPGRIIISCVGAHGRTGTAMASLVLAADAKQTVEGAIKFVRKNHCPKAIESDFQVEYLRSFRPLEESKYFDTCATDRKREFPSYVGA